MEMYLFFNFIFFELCITGLLGLQQSSVPQIYPNKLDITVDAHTDLTIGCRGAEPMDWDFPDAVNAKYYNTSQKNITHMYNEKELIYKYETILTVYNVSRINVGFFYCHGENVNFNTPRRSSRIYIFVQDDNNFSVITSEENMYFRYKWFATIPCRPTSPDTNVTLTCSFGYFKTISFTSSNYSLQIEDYTVQIRFHLYYGFTLEYLDNSYSFSNCVCEFKRNNKMLTVKMDMLFEHNDEYLNDDGDTVIEGPDTADVGDNLTLQCAYLGTQHFPYHIFWPQWYISNNGNLQIIKLKSYILQLHIIKLKNISTEDERIYKCEMDTRLEYVKSATKYVFVNDNHTAPRILSVNETDIQINSGANITLRCEGSRPVTWHTRTQINGYIEYLSKNKTGLYESCLHLLKARYEHTGYYYCHENGSAREHPFKSARVYIYVKDKQNLYLPQKEEQEKQRNNQVYPYTNVTMPCLTTSRDVNVSLSIENQNYDFINWKWGPKQMMDPVIYGYDPREGFIVQVPECDCDRIIITCTFVTETAKNDTLAIEYYIRGDYFKSEPYITGPYEDFVFVGQFLELACAVLVRHNVSDDALSWSAPNHLISSKISVKAKRINVRRGKVLISKLLLNNVKDADEGWYFCASAYNNATTRKFISVYDKFNVTPSIEILQYDQAYIGQPLVLRCKVDVDHNVDFHMSWTTPNGTETKAKNINTEYVNIRTIFGESILQINNVTNKNEGYYTCFVFDFTNRRKNVTKHILVKRGVPPRIVTSNFNNQEEINVQFNEIANLTCSAEGDPQAKITWMKGSSVVQNPAQYIGFPSNNSELIIYNVQGRDAGLYTCIAENPFGRDSRAVNLRVNSGSLSGYIATVIIMLNLCVAVAVLLAIRSYRKKKLLKQLTNVGFINFQSGQIQSLNPFLNIAEQANLLPYDTKWEIPRNHIELGRNLGSGYFGLVVEATISNFFDGEPEKTVAVKMLHRNSNFIELNSLICELKILANLEEHVNLINLLGACTEKITEGKLLVVLEYCKYGSLRSYLIENRCNFVNLINPGTEHISLPAYYSETLQELDWCGSGSVNTMQLLHWALQMARGMEFLAGKQVLHGDLAARNILLTENYVVKISDFGLSKTLSSSGFYKKKSQCPLPVKWMAIESIRDKTFSTQSDVWAFGVVLWELFSLARTPYAELEPDFRFYRKLESGYRLGRPEYSTREVYQVMQECWRAQPQCRPTFPNLVCTLDDLLQEPNNRCSANEETTDIANRAVARSLVINPNEAAAPDWIVLDILTPTPMCKFRCSVEKMSN